MIKPELQRVYNRLVLLLGDFDGEQELLFTLCSAALSEIKNRLRRREDEDDERLTAAAAGIAYYKLALIRSAREEGAVSFKAGDVTVNKNSRASLEGARVIRDEALHAAAGLLKDEAFLFRRVEA